MSRLIYSERNLQLNCSFGFQSLCDKINSVFNPVCGLCNLAEPLVGHPGGAGETCHGGTGKE